MTIDELIAKWERIEKDGRIVGDIAKLAAALKVAIPLLECLYPAYCPDPADGTICKVCQGRAEIERIVEGGT